MLFSVFVGTIMGIGFDRTFLLGTYENIGPLFRVVRVACVFSIKNMLNNCAMFFDQSVGRNVEPPIKTVCSNISVRKKDKSLIGIEIILFPFFIGPYMGPI